MKKNPRMLLRPTDSQSVAIISTLSDLGLSYDSLIKIHQDEDLAKKVVRIVNNEIIGSVKLDRQLLLSISDDRFFGPIDWFKYYGLKIKNFELPFTMVYLDLILNEPCPFIADKKIKDTHYLFCVPDDFDGVPLTVNKWIAIYHDEDKKVFFDEANSLDYTESYFAETATARCKWYLMFEGLLPESLDKNFEEQVMPLFMSAYDLPMTVEVITMLLLINEKNGYLVDEKMNIGGRTADNFSENDHVTVGTCENGVFIYDGPVNSDSNWEKSDETKDPKLGIYVMRKL